MTLLTWGLEWRVALNRRRLFVLNVLVPLLLVVPIATGAAPAVHAAAVYAVLFTMFSTFGSAIPLVRDGASGVMARIIRGGISPRSYLVQRSAAGAVLDLVQLGPAFLLAALGAGASPGSFLLGLGALAATAWIGNMTGTLVAAATRSLAEAALFTAVATLLLLHMSGVFRTPAPGSYGAVAEAASPFRTLHESLLNMTEPTAVGGGAATIAWVLFLPLLMAVLAGAVARSLGRASHA